MLRLDLRARLGVICIKMKSAPWLKRLHSNHRVFTFIHSFVIAERFFLTRLLPTTIYCTLSVFSIELPYTANMKFSIIATFLSMAAFAVAAPIAAGTFDILTNVDCR